MKFTLDWLRNYVSLDGIPVEQIADQLTMLGLEVDAVVPLYDHLAPLKTGFILRAEKHPDADKLQVCEVRIGSETFRIVCGAPNARKDLPVVVALPGATLPGDIKIKKSKVRGVESAGMICSERELGLSTDHSGIMELPQDIKDGESFIESMGLADTMIEVDLTPNRPDCASVIGIARELAGINRKELCLPPVPNTLSARSNSFSVEIEAPELCPRYSARLIKNVTIGPSPWWLRKRLLSIGLRPINNIVDVTNFVMMEYGQPLHAFDFDQLSGKKIVVRTPAANELTFTTLDGSARQIDPSSLLICDAEKPVALAGIMGGLNSEVTNQTTNVLLESAFFSPVSIRKTARKVGLSTDASYRFERGIDINNTVAAMNRAVELLCEVSGGAAEESGIDAYPGQKDLSSILLSVQHTNDLIGINLTAAQIAELLQSITIPVNILDTDRLEVYPPSFRVDIEREADLIEEVARLYGYNNIPVHLPSVSLSYPEQSLARKKRAESAHLMLSIGFSEAINYSFNSEKNIDLLGLSPEDVRRNFVKLLNPLSEEQAILRTSLLPGLLENVKRNISFQKPAIKLFEIGKVFEFYQKDSQPFENMRIAGVLSGNRYGENSPLHFHASDIDIYDAKGAVELLFDELRVSSCSKSDLQFIHPAEDGIEPFVEPEYSLLIFATGKLIGSLGKITNEVLRSFGIKQDVYYFDINFDELCGLSVQPKAFSSLPVYPAVVRDISITVPNAINAGAIVEKIKQSGEKLIESVSLFDVFQGDKIQRGYKSVAVSITYRSASKTLTEKSVEKSHEKIVRLVTDSFGGNLREA